ncbi:hypothetical protein AcdelDRAFT_1236 [Acidovorax delafieldii 2AN]|uniref:Uncharacterized protein n=1 Tax=Acidovorax delafieldii 2AN TaxID=573060 RepID=C5T2V6_ACIDE|nr:hypothetical protein AcdelDRAFT_1236 [Acidovorax delafieldii 2AN]
MRRRGKAGGATIIGASPDGTQTGGGLGARRVRAGKKKPQAVKPRAESIL